MEGKNINVAPSSHSIAASVHLILRMSVAVIVGSIILLFDLVFLFDIVDDVVFPFYVTAEFPAVSSEFPP